jgi:hypothetical protein
MLPSGAASFILFLRLGREGMLPEVCSAMGLPGKPHGINGAGTREIAYNAKVTCFRRPGVRSDTGNSAARNTSH